MVVDGEVYERIAGALLREYTRIYYIDANTNEYVLFSREAESGTLNRGPVCEDFFRRAHEKAESVVYAADRHVIQEDLRKDLLLSRLNNGANRSIVYRLMVDGKPRYHTLRVIRGIGTEDEYFVLGVIDCDEKFRKDEAREKKLQDANRMAKRDELTGVRNKNAYQTYVASIQQKICYDSAECRFAVVVCDMNDLKHINDTKGHGVGDEYIQKTCYLICEVFDHSPVFRIGGDEFVAILNERDYEKRDSLMDVLRDRSIMNLNNAEGPVVASGMAVFDPQRDRTFDAVFDRADKHMYKNKTDLKNVRREGESFGHNKTEMITETRKRMLDSLFEAIYAVSDEDYVYLCDIRYDYSRVSLRLVDDFNLPSEYGYDYGKILEQCVHPDDKAIFRKATNAIFSGDKRVANIRYRMKNNNGKCVICGTRGFVLSDENRDPEYFGGIIFSSEELDSE